MLVATVLLQPGKTDAGALFTSNVASTAFAPRGTASVLAKFTIGAAIVFMLTALMISLPALSGDRSVLSANPEETIETTEPAPAAAPPEGEAPAQTIVEPGNDQTVTFPANSAANTSSNTGQPAAPLNANTRAVPLQENPPSQ